MLMGRRGLTGFRNTLSESNTTHKSVPMLLSHLDARTFGDSVYRVKGVAEAFREAGFRTAFFSNQQRNGSFIDFFGEQADTCVFLRDNFSGPAVHGPKDKDLLALVDSELHHVKARKRLVILHTYGSHFRYDDAIRPARKCSVLTASWKFRRIAANVWWRHTITQYTIRHRFLTC